MQCGEFFDPLPTNNCCIILPYFNLIIKFCNVALITIANYYAAQLHNICIQEDQ